MRKTLLILICLSSLYINAQDLRNIFIGRYAGISKQTNVPGNTFYDYNSLAEIVYGDSSLQRVYFYDSCSWSNWSGATGAQLAYPDSTLREWGAPNYIYGKLFPNDSLYFSWSDNFGSFNVIEEFFGFKLYSTVGSKELADPGHELLLSPQPANDVLYIQSIQTHFKGKPVLYDINGKQVNAEMLYINTNTYKVDVSQLQAGIYFIFVMSEKGYVRKKLVVIH